MNNSYNRNTTISPEARMALNQMKAEIARELNIADPQAKDRGNLTSRQNGYVGGYISKKTNNLVNKNINNKIK